MADVFVRMLVMLKGPGVQASPRRQIRQVRGIAMMGTLLTVNPLRVPAVMAGPLPEEQINLLVQAVYVVISNDTTTFVNLSKMKGVNGSLTTVRVVSQSE